MILKNREMKLSPFILFVLLVSCEDMQTSITFNEFTDDRDGQTYATVEIGDKTWMAENLNYSPQGSDYLQTDKYGILYPFNTAVTICPDGWRLPTDEEWGELIEYYPDDVALRTSDFKAELGGWVNGGNYFGVNRIGAWWTGTDYQDGYAWVYYIKADSDVTRISQPKSSMMAVRCIKDY